MVSRRSPVLVSRMVTLAPNTTAPLASRTLPVIVPVETCATIAGTAIHINTARRRNHTMRGRIVSECVILGFLQVRISPSFDSKFIGLQDDHLVVRQPRNGELAVSLIHANGQAPRRAEGLPGREAADHLHANVVYGERRVVAGLRVSGQVDEVQKRAAALL